MHHADHRQPVGAQRDAHGVDRQSDRHVVGAVQRIDEPDPVAVRPAHPGLLGDDLVTRVGLLQPAEDEFLRGQVQIGHHVPAGALGLDPAGVAVQQLAGRLGGVDRHPPCPFQIHGSISSRFRRRGRR
jgi:hypothetical protein